MIATLVLFPIVLSTFGAAQYGAWLFLFALANVLFYADLGVGTAIVHFTARERGGDTANEPHVVLVSGLAWSLVGLAVATPIYWAVGYLYVQSHAATLSLSSQDQELLLWSGFAIVATLVSRPFSMALMGAGEYAIERLSQIAGLAFRVTFTFLACFAPIGSIGLVGVAEAGAVVLPTLIAAVLLKVRHPRATRLSRPNLRTLRVMMNYSGRAFVVSLTGAVILQAGPLILGLSGSPASVAYYSAAFRLYAIVRQLLAWALDPFRTAYSRLFAKTLDSPWPLLRTILSMTYAIALVGCTAVAIVTPLFMSVWLGNNVPVGEVSAITLILLGGMVLNSLHLPLVPIVDSFGNPGAFLPAQVTWLVIFVAGALLLAPTYGGIGVAIAMSAPLLLVELLYLRKASRILKFSVAAWFRQVLWATTIPLLPAALISFAVGVSSLLIWGPGWAQISTLIVWVFSACTAYVLRRNHPPLEGARALLRLEM